MKSLFETSIAGLALAGLLALPAALPGAAYAAGDDESMLDSAKDGAGDAAGAVKDGAKKAGRAIKDGAKSAAGTVSGAGSDTGSAVAAKITGGDKTFAKKAAIGGMFEVKSAELAKEKAASEDVKAFAEQMIKDHTAANDELAGIVREKGIEPPAELDTEHQVKLDKLAKLEGKKFDAAYLKQQRAGHEKMLKLMDRQAKNGEDAELKAFAEKTRAVVAEHHAEVEKIAGADGSRAVSSGK